MLMQPALTSPTTGRADCCARHVAECGQQFPPSDSDCHTPLPCARCVERTIAHRERTVLTPRHPARVRRARCALYHGSAARQWRIVPAYPLIFFGQFKAGR